MVAEGAAGQAACGWLVWLRRPPHAAMSSPVTGLFRFCSRRLTRQRELDRQHARQHHDQSHQRHPRIFCPRNIHPSTTAVTGLSRLIADTATGERRPIPETTGHRPAWRPPAQPQIAGRLQHCYLMQRRVNDQRHRGQHHHRSSAASRSARRSAGRAPSAGRAGAQRHTDRPEKRRADAQRVEDGVRRQQQHGHTEYAGDGGEHRQPGRALPVDTRARSITSSGWIAPITAASPPGKR